MARVSRRKTLSHSEIENFLSEINTNDSQTGIGNIDAKPVPYDDFSTTTSAVSTPAVDPMRTEVQLVREFCKATFQSYRNGTPIEPTTGLCEVGRGILAGSKYPIMSTRLLKPEAYLYPASSLEAKKALLLSLSPMLSDAEEQRQKETSACENFTRCKSGKGKGKFACYDYTDVDVKCQVDFAEYEKRYMMYISSNKKTYAKDTPLSPSLNYITLQHRQRIKAERNIQLPKRNLNSILKGQLNDENQPQRVQSPGGVPSVSKALSKPKIEPVKLDDSTVELVASLLQKPTRSTSRAKSNLTAAIAAASPESAAFVRTVTSPAPTSSAVPVESELIRSPFEKLCNDKQIASPMRPTKPPVPVSPSESEAIAVASPVAESPMQESAEEDVSMDVSTDDMDFQADVEMETDSSGSNDRKRKHGRGNRSRLMARRGTLSPASVRAMLEEACAAESEGVTTSVLLGNNGHNETADADEEDMCVSYAVTADVSYSIRAPGELFGESADGSDLLQCVVTEGTEVTYYEALSDDAERSDSPHESEHTKKYARSGSPSTNSFFSTVDAPMPAVTVELAAFQAVPSISDAEVPSPASELYEEVSEQVEVLENGAETATEGSFESCQMETVVVVSVDDVEIDTVIVCDAIIHAPESPEQQVEPLQVNVGGEEAEVTESRLVIEMSETDMDVIDDFGRELDNILCDVSSLGYSSPDDLLSPVSPTDSAGGECGAVLHQFVGSPERPVPSSPIAATPEISQIDATPMSPPSPEACTVAVELSCESAYEANVITDSAEFTAGVASPERTATTPELIISPEKATEDVEEGFVATITVETTILSEDPAGRVEEEEMHASEEQVAASVQSQQPSPAPHANIFTSPTKVLLSPTSAVSTPGNELYSYLDAHRPMLPPTPPSIPRRSAPSPKVGQFSPMARSGASSKASSPCSPYSPASGGDMSMNRSLDESHLMFSEHDEDLETFEMLESMVEKEFESGSITWDFGLPVAPVLLESTPQTTIPQDLLADNAGATGDASASKPSEPHNAAEIVAGPAPESSSGSAMTPLRSPEPSALSSAERRRRGLSSIPRYSTAQAHASPVPTSAIRTPLAIRCADETAPVRVDAEGTDVEQAVAVQASSVSESWPAELIDIAVVEAQARARYLERVEVARWQCEWDIVSAQTANAAIKKYTGLC